MSELRECPKCWSTAVTIVYTIDCKRFRGECQPCGFRTPDYFTKAEAIEAWNARTPDPRLQEAVREIEKMEYDWAAWAWDKQTAAIEILEVIRKHIPESKEK